MHCNVILSVTDQCHEDHFPESDSSYVCRFWFFIFLRGGKAQEVEREEWGGGQAPPALALAQPLAPQAPEGILPSVTASTSLILSSYLMFISLQLSPNTHQVMPTLPNLVSRFPSRYIHWVKIALTFL